MADTVVVAIDGPAASGKSTVARAVAKSLGYRFLNSGDLYRTMTWVCLQRGTDCHDALAVARLASATRIELRCEAGEIFPVADGEDARPHLRDEDVNANVSPVAAVPAVREILSEAIRACARGAQTVIEGRDIGSAVFPGTPFKFYIDACPQVRQRRRQKQGQTEEVARRDRIDSTRATAPLKIAKGAKVIDTSHLDVDGVVGAVLGGLRELGLPGAERPCSKG